MGIGVDDLGAAARRGAGAHGSEGLRGARFETISDYAALRDHCCNDEVDLQVVAPLFDAIEAKIFAGSAEIKRKILARAVLDLPT